MASLCNLIRLRQVVRLCRLVSVVALSAAGAAAQPTKANDVRTPPKSEHVPSAKDIATTKDGPLKPGSVPGCSLIRVIDVRTLAVQVDADQRELHLLGIEPASIDPDMRRAVMGFVENALKGETLTVVVPPGLGVDKDAHPLVILRREPEGLDIGLELLRQGFAKLDSKFDEQAAFLAPTQADQYRAASAKAKDLKKGLWASPPKAPLAPAGNPPDKSAPDKSTQPATDKHAADPKQSPAGSAQEIVFITPSGKKYHKENCKFLSKNAKPITLEEARKKYEPCGTCNPPK